LFLRFVSRKNILNIKSKTLGIRANSKGASVSNAHSSKSTDRDTDRLIAAVMTLSMISRTSA
jgi:hypothetical protein